MRSVDDLTTKARIRDAAIARFPRDGYAGTTLRAVAHDVGASPALVLHHYGSKEGLRRACDEHVIAELSALKHGAIEQRSHADAGAIASAYRLVPPLLRYFAWSLAAGGPTAARLFDDMVDEIAAQLREGIAAGIVDPIDEVPEQAAVLAAMGLGGLVLHEHLSRALRIDVLSPAGLAHSARFSLPILSGRLFNAEMMEEAAAAVEEVRHPSRDAEATQ
jgi:AcrR family transcriptional regulator